MFSRKLLVIYFAKVLKNRCVMENIRNDHIYIQLMKQHMTKNEHITRYLRKPIFLENHNSNFCIFAPEGPREKTVQQNVRNGHIYIQLMKQHVS